MNETDLGPGPGPPAYGQQETQMINPQTQDEAGEWVREASQAMGSF